MKRQFQNITALAIILLVFVYKANGLNCYYCYLTSGCSDSFKSSNSDVYLAICYSNATACGKIVTSGGSTARGCLTSCTPSSTTSGSVSCCYTDYCNDSVRYQATLPIVLILTISILMLKTKLTS